jgi:hypothetical protein
MKLSKVILCLVLIFSIVANLVGAQPIAIPPPPSPPRKELFSLIDPSYAEIGKNGFVDVTFHQTPEEIQKTQYSYPFGTTWVYDKESGEMKTLHIPSTSETLGRAVFYDPASKPYGATSYVPSYEDAICFSKKN